MKKWIITGLLVLLMLSVQVGPVFANTDEQEAAAAGFEVLVPQKDRVTSREVAMLSFSAPQGSTVTVEVFHNASLTDEDNFTALYEPMIFEIGALERGWVELQLKKGMNRIFLTTYLNGLPETPVSALEVEADEDRLVIERRITVKDLEEVREELTRNVRETTATDLIRRLTNTTEIPQPTE
ncbi:hypothetical protein [Anoxynatronum sibiricum]|uniref:Uncharacterized protein n=1 Tax=Anoxynatronum sibiricum TaxID=210623 RepID=A0ABU9VSH3_9CLOT